MKSPISLFVSIALILFIVFTAVSYNGASLTTAKAKEFHEEAMDEIENSHFDSTVITTYKDKAVEKGYELQVINDGTYDHRPKYKITLKYHLVIPLFGMSNEQELEGYAS